MASDFEIYEPLTAISFNKVYDTNLSWDQIKEMARRSKQIVIGSCYAKENLYLATSNYFWKQLKQMSKK
ncbi:MAG: hypothetical protein EBS06_05395 [Proteobacteria bacterium]|nr:hypothetical protein [Pseudomonadota bacterium]